jgi:hypothetical protein
MQTPGRIKTSSYHAHKFYKTIKKRGNDLLSVRLCKFFKGTAHPKLKVQVTNTNNIKNFIIKKLGTFEINNKTY